MGQDNQEQSEPRVRVSKAQVSIVLQEVMEELNRREEEMHKDIYASRDYSDGVRFENRRMQQWLNEKMES